MQGLAVTHMLLEQIETDLPEQTLEIIDAVSLENPEDIIQIDVREEEWIFAGGFADKRWLRAIVDGVPRSLFERECNEKHILAWMACRAADVHVTSELRQGSNGALITPDLKEDGSEIYDKGQFIILNEKCRRQRAHRAIDEVFLEITSPGKIGDIKELIMERAKSAGNNGILLPDDDSFALHVHPDGEFEEITLDLEHTGWLLNPDQANPDVFRRWARKNEAFGTQFMTLLRFIRALIIDPNKRFYIPEFNGIVRPKPIQPPRPSDLAIATRATLKVAFQTGRN